MDKRALLAIALSFLVLVLWQIFLAPKPPAPLGPGQTGKLPPGAQTAGAQPGPAGGATGAAGEAPPGGPEAASGSSAANGGGPGSASEAGAKMGAASGAAGSAIAQRREAAADAGPVVIDTGLARIQLAVTGAKLESWTLKKYHDAEMKPYELVSPDSGRAGIYPFQFHLDDKALESLLNTRARFDVERGTVTHTRTGRTSAGSTAGGAPGASAAGATGASSPSESGGSGSQTADGTRLPATATTSTLPPEPETETAEQVRLIFSDGQGVEAVKTFTYWHDSYLLDVSATVTRNGQPVPGRIIWGPSIGTPSADDLSNRYYYGGRAIADFGTGATRYYPTKVTSPLTLAQDLRWAGLEEQYFAAVFIPDDGLEGTQIYPALLPAPPPPAPAPGQTAPPAADAKPVERLCVAVPMGQTYTLYAGPKDYQLLQALGRDLPELVNFAPGTPLIGPLVGLLAKMLWAVLRWLHSFIPNYGVGIILLTTAIKILFYPITQRAMVKMRGEQKKMQKVQPKVNAIKDKFRKAKDTAGRAKMNEEIMALYKREGINPMASLGGCLPLLLQLPILYGFYSVLTVSIELRQAPFFGWIHDLSTKDPYYITPIVMGISMFLQQKLAMTKVADPQQRAQQRMMMFMPIIFTWTFLHLPSGLVLYWFVNNVLGIVQQVLINRQAQAIEEAEAATAAG